MYNDTNTRYNQVRQKGSHNSFERTEGYDDQAIYWRLRGVEMDIHNGKGCTGAPQLDGDWYVYHYCSLGGLKTSIERLSDGLDTLLAFQRAVPRHEPMTVVLDLKDNFDATHTPQDLDDLLVSKLGREAIWGPPDLIAATGATDLQAAIGHSGWPTLAELHGKFLFALTGGDVETSGSKLNQYVDKGASANQRLGFVAPEISRTDQVRAKPYVVFFNLSGSHRGLGPAIFDAGFVSRTWGVNSADAWQQAVDAKIQHLSSDMVNTERDPWARTDNAHGYPFQGIDIDLDSTLTEPGSIYGIEVTSGDLWGRRDSCYFAYEQRGGRDLDGTRESFLASPASHVETWAKAALMARASLAEGAPYFALVRPAHSVLSVQYRLRDGEETRAVEVPIVPPDTVDEATLIWVRLELLDGGTRATGWGSLDGQRWQLITQQSFAAPLSLQGWAASSNGSSSVRFLFGAQLGQAVTLPQQAAIGAEASGTFFTGVYRL